MKHLAKRTLSLLLAALMVLSLIPASNHVHAAEITTAYYGTDKTNDPNLQLKNQYGTVKDNWLTSHAAWAVKDGGMGLVLSEAFREGFNGKATVEVEYLSANTFSSTFDLQYIANDGSVKTASKYTTETGTTLSNQAANIRVYELTDMGTTLGTIGSVTKPSSLAVTTDDTKYVGIRSIRVTKVAEAPAYAPEFNNADFGDYVFDQVESPALTVKNPHTDVEMTARIFVTIKQDGKEILTQRRLRKHEDGPLPTDAPVEIFSAGDMTSGTSAAAKYDLVVTSFIKVNGGDEVQIEKTLSFERANTFTQRFYEENGDLYYAVRKVAGAENVAPNNFRITITGETLENPKVVNANDYAYGTEAETVKNLTKDVMSTFEPGTYTVTIEAAKGTKLRSTVSYTYTIAEPPAFEPEFGKISTVLDNAAVPELTITNTHETLEMTTAIKATLKLNGELHPGVQNVSVGPEEAVAADQTATLISTELLSKYATAMGNWEIVLTGKVTVDGTDYPVEHTVFFTRTATFTHELVVSDGNIYYNAKAVSEEAVAYAPNGVKIYVVDAEGQVLAGPSKQPVTLTTADNPTKLNGVGIISSLKPGTHIIKVEAYRDSELRGTVTCEYIVAAPECEHPKVTNGACTATTQVTCPDCKQTVTVKAGHTWGEYIYNEDATCVADGTKTASCTVDGCEAKDTVTAEGTKKETHTWGEYTYNEDATCVADGTKTASCTVDGCEAKDTVTAEGTKDPNAHKMELTTPEDPATCGKDGKTEVLTCANGCGHQTGGDPISATGEHTYENKYDTTCNVCDFVRHIHAGTNATLGNSIDMNINLGLDKEKVENEQYTPKVSIDGVEVDGVFTLTENGTNTYYVKVPGLAAKDLNKVVTVTIYEGDTVVMEATDSFADYVERLINSTDPNVTDEHRTLAAKMALYATAAQNYFPGTSGQTVVEQLEENGVDYNRFTGEIETFEHERVVDDAEGLYQGSNFDLEENIVMNMYVRDVAYAEIEYTPYNSTEKVTKTIQAADCEKSGSYYKFRIEDFVTADGAKTVVTAKFYNAEGEQLVTVTDSMAAYVARMSERLTWLDTMLQYATAAYNALTD